MFVIRFGRLWLLRLCGCLCWSHCLRGGLIDSSNIYVEGVMFEKMLEELREMRK